MKMKVERSSGNVFADLGLPNPDQELLKAKLTLQIHNLLKARKLTQAEAAALLRTTQPQISALMRLRPVSVSVGLFSQNRCSTLYLMLQKSLSTS